MTGSALYEPLLPVPIKIKTTTPDPPKIQARGFLCICVCVCVCVCVSLSLSIPGCKCWHFLKYCRYILPARPLPAPACFTRDHTPRGRLWSSMTCGVWATAGPVMSLHIAHVTPAYFPGTTHHGVCLIGTPTLKKQFNFIMCADNGDADCYK